MPEDINHRDTPSPVTVQRELDELEEVHYPVQKEELLRIARAHQLDDSVIAMLEEVPADEITDMVSASTSPGWMK